MTEETLKLIGIACLFAAGGSLVWQFKKIGGPAQPLWWKEVSLKQWALRVLSVGLLFFSVCGYFFPSEAAGTAGTGFGASLICSLVLVLKRMITGSDKRPLAMYVLLPAFFLIFTIVALVAGSFGALRPNNALEPTRLNRL